MNPFYQYWFKICPFSWEYQLIFPGNPNFIVMMLLMFFFLTCNADNICPINNLPPSQHRCTREPQSPQLPQDSPGQRVLTMGGSHCEQTLKWKWLILDRKWLENYQSWPGHQTQGWSRSSHYHGREQTTPRCKWERCKGFRQIKVSLWISSKACTCLNNNKWEIQMVLWILSPPHPHCN